MPEQGRESTWRNEATDEAARTERAVNSSLESRPFVSAGFRLLVPAYLVSSSPDYACGRASRRSEKRLTSNPASRITRVPTTMTMN